MTRGKTTRLLARALGLVAGAVLITGLVLPLTARPAAACTVGIGYRPTIDASKPNLGVGQACANGTSIAGAVVIAALAAGALTATGIAAYRRGQAAARTASPDDALASYLDAVALASSPEAHGPEETLI